jgi:hypothetical protein
MAAQLLYLKVRLMLPFCTCKHEYTLLDLPFSILYSRSLSATMPKIVDLDDDFQGASNSEYLDVSSGPLQIQLKSLARETRATLAHLDLDGDGTLDVNELLGAVAKQHKQAKNIKFLRVAIVVS